MKKIFLMTILLALALPALGQTSDVTVKRVRLLGIDKTGKFINQVDICGLNNNESVVLDGAIESMTAADESGCIHFQIDAINAVQKIELATLKRGKINFNLEPELN